MIRLLARPLIFFAIPFLLYGIYLVVRLTNPFVIERWKRVALPLAFAGIVLAVGSIVALGLFAPRFEGGYVPAHIEDGRIVPGRMR